MNNSAMPRSDRHTVLAPATDLCMSLPAQAWEPAADTSAQQLLEDARQDVIDGRLAQAAEKHLWFHDHVLERDPAMSGVRLSFALFDWAELARRYPPAMEQLNAVRDRTLARMDAGGSTGQTALRELISLNTALQDPASTRDGFERLAHRDPALAERHTLDALPALIALNDVALASKHLQVEPALRSTEELYRSMKASMPRLPADSLAEALRAQQRYVELQLARVAYVLVKDGRDAEAQQVLTRGRALLGPEASVHHLNEAMRGIAPPDDFAR